MKDNKRTEVFLAALLHDIGKFYQRADETPSVNSSKFLSDEIKKLEDVWCPKTRDGKRTHKHILWTAQFFKDFEQHLKNLLYKDQNVKSIDRLMRLSSIHHYPGENQLDEKIIQKADHYSSGADRSKSEEAWKDASEEENWDSFKNVRMRSIFEGISLKYNNESIWKTNYNKRLTLSKLELSDSFLLPDATELNPDYAKLWSGFVAELKFLQTSSSRTFSNTMLFLLEKYTSRIPASTQHLPDVSLFDHSKMTAAFAVCLYDYSIENSNSLPANDTKPFLLIGGDLSGIQKYIYGIIARGAAKNLKGRSFYLQLLVDNIVNKLINELQLFDANIVYKSGGSFYLLAPNNEKVKEKLRKFENRMTESLFETHKTELALLIDFVEFGEEELIFEKDKIEKRTIGNMWSDLSEKISRKKSQRFLTMLKTDYKKIFEPSDYGGVTEIDAITGEEISLDEELTRYDNYVMKDYTRKQIELGVKLRQVNYWVHSTEELSYFPEKFFNPAGIGGYNYFVNDSFFKNDQNRQELRKSADKIRAMAINNTDFLETPQKGVDNIYGFYFYGGNKYPESNWNKTPKTFEELAGAEFADENKTIRITSPNLLRIGILRMDVDNLGAIFKRGLSPDKRSFSRYSVLSRSLDFFFSGYLNKIWESKPDYYNYTQIIYSGGDDLFIVGRWDVLIEFAVEINSYFKKWVCDNPDLSISGGISFVYPKFPVLKAAEMAAYEEKNAKNHFYAGKEKNAFSIFGYAFDWEYEFPYLKELKDEIIVLFEAGLSKGFATDIYVLMNKAGLLYNKANNRYVISNYQVVWYAAYNFKRATQRINDEAVKNFLQSWIENIFIGKIEKVDNSKYHALQFLAIASRWASFEIRK